MPRSPWDLRDEEIKTRNEVIGTVLPPRLRDETGPGSVAPSVARTELPTMAGSQCPFEVGWLREHPLASFLPFLFPPHQEPERSVGEGD